MAKLSDAQVSSRAKAYGLARDILQQAIELLTDDAVFSPSEAAANEQLLQNCYGAVDHRSFKYDERAKEIWQLRQLPGSPSYLEGGNG